MILSRFETDGCINDVTGIVIERIKVLGPCYLTLQMKDGEKFMIARAPSITRAARVLRPMRLGQPRMRSRASNTTFLCRMIALLPFFMSPVKLLRNVG